MAASRIRKAPERGLAARATPHHTGSRHAAPHKQSEQRQARARPRRPSVALYYMPLPLAPFSRSRSLGLACVPGLATRFDEHASYWRASSPQCPMTVCTCALLLALLSLGTPSSALLLSAPRSTRTPALPSPPRLSTPVVCSAHSRRKKRAKLPVDELTAPMQGGVGLQLSTAADGLPLPTCVVAFDQEPASGAQQPVQPVRLVIISDTHGFEQSMTNRSAMAQQSMANSKPAAAAAADDDDEDEDDPDDPAAAAAAAAAAPAAPWATAALPEGDVLIHCGDFAPGPIWPNGESVRPDEAQARFDSWLAVQPHPLKVVVRGNHDPRHALFPRSGAVYATSPRALELEVRGPNADPDHDH